MNNLNKFEIVTLIAILSGAVWVGALMTKVEFLREDYGAVKEEREETINEIQSQKENVLADIQRAKQQAINPVSINELRDNIVEIEQRLQRVQQVMNGTQIKAFESQLVKFETRITQVQQTLGTLQIAELQTPVASVEGKLDIKAINVNGLKTNFAQLKNELNVLNQSVAALKEKIATTLPKVEPKKLAIAKVEPKGQSSGKGIFRHRLKIGGNGPEMVTIPAGRFQMGGNRYDSEKPIHLVSIKTFAMSRYEITFDEYDAFAKATGKTKPNDHGWGRGNRPVINVSWHDAVAYTEWLSEQTSQQYRLPTEAEWEYVARAGTETNYWWGNEIGKNWANCDGCGGEWDNKQTAPVGSFKANPFGLYDTAGNVWEWCADNWHGNYKGAPTDGSVWKGGNKDRRVLRGGSWAFIPDDCRTVVRIWYSSNLRDQDFGFRVAVAV